VTHYGVVNENVDSAAIRCELHQLSNLRRYGEIGIVEAYLDAVFSSEIASRPFGILLRSKPIENYTAAFCRKAVCNRKT
jgi:hypothetical protein